jgi:hypothetical protein
MKNLVFSLFAIALAGLAAIAATTAMLNTPVANVHGIAPPASEKKTDAPAVPAPPGPSPGQTTGDTPAPAPAPTPEAGKPAPGGAGQPPSEPAPAGAAKPATSEEPEVDQDPYEGIAPEDLPPDLQYDADSSVSFPTNT